MLKETYCSYEVSKLLKEKGFNCPCHATYDTAVTGGKPEFSEYAVLNFFPYGMKNSDDKYGMVISAPTHQIAMKWLREVHRIFICIEFDAPTFVADMYKMDEIDEYGCAKHIPPTIANCKTHEEAVEAALKYILLNII